MSFVKVSSTSELNAGEAISVTIVDENGVEKPVAVICDTNGDFYAIDDLCTHGDVRLSEGDIGDKCVQCWAHGAEFDLCSGQATLPATEDVKVYSVRLEGNNILVDVDKSKDK